MKAENVRGHEKDFTLDKSGFEFHKVPSIEKKFEDDEEIQKGYYNESIQHIKDLTGASRVVIFDHSEYLPCVLSGCIKAKRYPCL